MKDKDHLILESLYSFIIEGLEERMKFYLPLFDAKLLNLHEVEAEGAMSSDEAKKGYIRHIADEIDPTVSKEYMGWILKMIKNGNLRYPEDNDKYKDRLTKFDSLKKKPNFPKDKRDINSYKTYGELVNIISEFGNVQTKGEVVRQSQEEGKELLKEVEQYKLFEITKPEAAAKNFRHTEWCVKDPSWFKDYNPKIFYFVTKDEKPYRLLHFITDQWMDINNDAVDLSDDIEGDKAMMELLNHPKILTSAQKRNPSDLAKDYITLYLILPLMKEGKDLPKNIEYPDLCSLYLSFVKTADMPIPEKYWKYLLSTKDFIEEKQGDYDFKKLFKGLMGFPYASYFNEMVPPFVYEALYKRNARDFAQAMLYLMQASEMDDVFKIIPNHLIKDFAKKHTSESSEVIAYAIKKDPAYKLPKLFYDNIFKSPSSSAFAYLTLKSVIIHHAYPVALRCFQLIIPDKLVKYADDKMLYGGLLARELIDKACKERGGYQYYLLDRFIALDYNEDIVDIDGSFRIFVPKKIMQGVTLESFLKKTNIRKSMREQKNNLIKSFNKIINEDELADLLLKKGHFK
jgi:hypothetical protein